MGLYNEFKIGLPSYRIQMAWVRFTLVYLSPSQMLHYLLYVDYIPNERIVSPTFKSKHLARMRAELNRRLEQWKIFVESSNVGTTRHKQLQSLLGVISQSTI